jgi:hypothetical protein
MQPVKSHRYIPTKEERNVPIVISVAGIKNL